MSSGLKDHYKLGSRIIKQGDRVVIRVMRQEIHGVFQAYDQELERLCIETDNYDVVCVKLRNIQYIAVPRSNGKS